MIEVGKQYLVQPAAKWIDNNWYRVTCNVANTNENCASSFISNNLFFIVMSEHIKTRVKWIN